MTLETALNHEYFMAGLSVLHLRFIVRSESPIMFDAQPGTALRGALYHALREHYCSAVTGFAGLDHQKECPVCWLMAQEDYGRGRGRNVPRPLTIQPPPTQQFRTGEIWMFGLGLIGKAQEILPYLLRAVQAAGKLGVGRGRGTFSLRDIEEYSPLLDASRSLQENHVIRRATLHVTPSRITEASKLGEAERINLKFMSPLRLIANEKALHVPTLDILLQRLVERMQDMRAYYGTEKDMPSRDQWIALQNSLCEQAQHTTLAFNDTQWLDIYSGSQRNNSLSPVSGIVGDVRWEGTAVAVLRPWLLWGQSLHVGKDAVKGNGWYRVLN